MLQFVIEFAAITGKQTVPVQAFMFFSVYFYHIYHLIQICSYVFVFCITVLVVQRFGVGLVIERSLVRLPAGALSSQLGQLSCSSLRGR